MDIYEDLLNIVKTENDLEEFLTHEDKFEYLYNLSNIRKNILEWYDFSPDARLLELGAECGALTGLFCDRLKGVVAIEEDERKNAVNLARNDKYDNLIVKQHIESIEEILIKEKPSESKNRFIKFDYVTIIGGFSEEKLSMAVKYLKKGGQLIIAIDNKYGIKYWAGAHRGINGNAFDCITNCRSIDGDRTFSKNQIKALIKKVGLKKPKFYYPVPDYKIPLEIFSDDRLPGNGDIEQNSPSYDKDRYLMFDETKAINGLSADNKFDYFSNSFLVFSNK